MIRIHVICEGQTEEMFVNEVLAESFVTQGIYLQPSLIGKPGQKGGNFRFERLLIDIRARLLGDPTAYCTTFFDFYGLPANFPGKQEAMCHSHNTDKAHCISDAMNLRLQSILGSEAMRRFIPYVQMYEFEGLLFSDTKALAQSINQPVLIASLQAIRAAFASPEMINDSPETAPSKRLLALFAGYDKPFHGSLAALEIGLDNIRQECPLFNAWLNRLAQLQ
ncbi:MAG: hypothetical protein RI964_3340 [Pseudomonadota bacterium]|jgi:hypothetical protein